MSLIGVRFDDILSFVNSFAIKNYKEEYVTSDSLKYELVVAAIKEKKYYYALLALENLLLSDNKTVRAKAKNIKAILAQEEGNFNLAEDIWSEVVKENESNEEVKINLAHLYLKYAHFSKADRLIKDDDKSPYSSSAKIVTSRLLGSNNKSNKICLELSDNNDMTAYFHLNCAIYHLYTNKDANKANKHLNKIFTHETSC